MKTYEIEFSTSEFPISIFAEVTATTSAVTGAIDAAEKLLHRQGHIDVEYMQYHRVNVPQSHCSATYNVDGFTLYI